MNEINVTNKTKVDVDLNLLKEVANYTLKYEKVDNAVANIIIIENEEIKRINKEYRNIDRVTDVISFALEDDSTFIDLPIRVLGDIYISIEKASKQAIEYGHSLKRELAFLTTHGMLHLLGYDHMKKEEEEIMFKKQDDILDKLNIRKIGRASCRERVCLYV